MVADKIKMLREQNGITHAQLSKRLGITRSCVNAWEMGISVPSTQYIVELATTFHVSTDFLLGLDDTSTVNVTGLSDEEVVAVNNLVQLLRKNKDK